MSEARGRRKSGGGRDARKAARANDTVKAPAFITRQLNPFEVLDEAGLELIERNADTILEEVGIDFRDDPEAVAVLKAAGAIVDGERVRFPRGMC